MANFPNFVVFVQMYFVVFVQMYFFLKVLKCKTSTPGLCSGGEGEEESLLRRHRTQGQQREMVGLCVMVCVVSSAGVMYRTVLYSIVLYCTVQYCIVLYCTLL